MNPPLLQSMHTKRDDLQCWRALSILAVLFFHIWPEIFPNGYLGVDIFFVLSGYLMASLYFFDKNPIASTMDYYYRRVKRILPIYLLVIILTVIILSYEIYQEQFNFIIEDSRWAIILATNYEDLLKQRGYFDMESNFRFFRHCWSLAVEMQFYLLFPFLAITRTYISRRVYQIFLIFIIITSFCYQIFSSNPIVQYESLFCRIWQFALGMLAQTLPVLSIKLLPNILILLSTVIMFCSTILPRLASSFFVIAMVSGIISMSTAESDPFKTMALFSNFHQHLVILGDISYILYLIHWPLITYARFVSSEAIFTFFFGSMLFATSIFLARLGHNIIEKPLLRICTSFRNVIVILIFLYVFAFFVPLTLRTTTPPHEMDTIRTTIPPDTDTTNDTKSLTPEFWKTVTQFDTPLSLPPKWSTKNDIEVANIMKNEYLAGMDSCHKQETIKIELDHLYYCEVNGKNPNATKTSMIIGNSYSMNLIPAISANPLFSKTYSIWISAKTFPSNDSFEKLLMEKYIKPLKPDVLFIVQFYYQKYLFNTPINKISEHKEFKYWNTVLQDIEKYTSAIIINKDNLEFPYRISEDYIRRKTNNLSIPLTINMTQKYPVMEKWLTSLNCSKCQFFDYREAFCDGDSCRIIDFVTGLPLFRDTGHVSHLGLRYLKPILDKAVNKGLRICNY